MHPAVAIALMAQLTMSPFVAFYVLPFVWMEALGIKK